jgi:predicted membrane channel-forming protein YqfA (hemolysin III family)
MLSRKKNPRIAKFAHSLTGLVVIIKGVDKAEHFEQHPVIPVLLIIIGSLIIIATFFHHQLEKTIKEFKTLLFVFEGCALLLVSYYFFAAGKKLLPFAFLIAAIAYFIVAIILYRKKIKELRTSTTTL